MVTVVDNQLHNQTNQFEKTILIFTISAQYKRIAV